MQLSRDDLLKAYHQMRTIREFEERVHDEFSAGNIPGFVHLYAGEEASGVGLLHAPDRRRPHRQHPSRPRPLHRQGLRHRGDDARDLRPQGRPVRRQGRLDAHRRPREGHDGRQRHRRRRPAADLRRRAHRQDAEDRRRGDRLRRRRRLEPGHHASRATTSPRSGTCRRSSSSRTTATPRSTASAWSVGGSQVGRAEGFGMPGHRGRRQRLLRRLRGRPRGDRARPRAAAAPAWSTSGSTATSGISRATP